MRHLSLTRDTIDPNELVALVSDHACGAVSTFFGTTRISSEDGAVLHLEYEAYESMAISELNKIADECESVWPGVKHLAIVHRLGIVPVGQISIGIAASSAHRSDALQAVQHTIDAIKTKVPIWKKEVYASQSTGCWKRNTECFWSAEETDHQSPSSTV